MTRLWIAAGLALAGFGAGWLVNGWRLSGTLEAERAAHAQAVAVAMETARVAEVTARAIEQARVEQIAEIANDAGHQINRARMDAAAAAAVSRRLRERIAALTAPRPAPEGAPPTERGQAATGPGLVLPDLFGRADDAAGELAEALDRSRAAGLACERSYDALRRPHEAR